MKILKLLLIVFGIFFISCEQYDTKPSLDIHGESISSLGRSTFINDSAEFMPLGVIPEWVKDSLSSENYELLKKLSTKFKIKYYLLKKNKSSDSCVAERNQQLNRLLANGKLDTIIVSSKEQIKTNALDRIEVLSRGESGDINPGYDYASTILKIETITHGAANLIVKAYLTWQKNVSTRDFKDISLRADMVGNGLVGGSHRWVDGGSRADKQADRIRYVVIGTAEIFSGLNNVGLVLSRDINRISSINPFN